MSENTSTPMPAVDLNSGDESGFSIESLKEMLMDNKEYVLAIIVLILAYYLYTQNVISLPSTLSD